jgi:hypothetical protein
MDMAMTLDRIGERVRGHRARATGAQSLAKVIGL